MAETQAASTEPPTAVRAARATGRAHLWAGTRSGGWYDTACGRTVSRPQMVPWAATADEYRCARCAALAARLDAALSPPGDADKVPAWEDRALPSKPSVHPPASER